MDEVTDYFTRVIRDLRGRARQGDPLDRAVAIAPDTITGCDHACVTLVVRRGAMLETVAASSDIARRADQLQDELVQGPYLDAVPSHETTLCRDLRADERWPHWGPRAARDLGVQSMLCCRLFTARVSYAGLSLYSDHLDAFDDDDQAVGRALATDAAAGLLARRKMDTTDMAITRQTTIGQAQRILMERYGVTIDESLQFLSRASRDTRRTVSDVAAELLRTGQMPEP